MQIQSIQVLGSGCQNCKKLFETTKKIIQDLKIDVEVQYVTDMRKIIEMNVLTTPVLAINNKPVLTGKGHGEEEVKFLFINYQK